MESFHKAVKFDNLTRVKDMLDDDPDLIGQANCSGMTPLMFAVLLEPSSIEMVNELIARGAEVNDMTRDGETALYWVSGI